VKKETVRQVLAVLTSSSSCDDDCMKVKKETVRQVLAVLLSSSSCDDDCMKVKKETVRQVLAVLTSCKMLLRQLQHTQVRPTLQVTSSLWPPCVADADIVFFYIFALSFLSLWSPYGIG